VILLIAVIIAVIIAIVIAMSSDYILTNNAKKLQ